MSRNQRLLIALRAANITNENGDQIVDFKNQNRDCLDFASLSRGEIKRLLELAFREGYLYAVTT